MKKLACLVVFSFVVGAFANPEGGAPAQPGNAGAPTEVGSGAPSDKEKIADKKNDTKKNDKKKTK